MIKLKGGHPLGVVKIKLALSGNEMNSVFPIWSTPGIHASIPEQGMSLCFAWQGHVGAGSSPDQVCGARRPWRQACLPE